MDPKVQVEIISGPLSAASELRCADAGAVLCFEGVVRPIEQERTITALEYEVYRPMAERELERLALSIQQKYSLSAIHVLHSEGIVPAGACSFRLQVLAAHRGPAIRALEEFIDRMKQDVPIWKRPVFAEQEVAR